MGKAKFVFLGNPSGSLPSSNFEDKRKWNLRRWQPGAAGRGEVVDYAKPLRRGPTDHGFDSFFGIPASLDIAPYFFIENDRVVEGPTTSIEEHHTPGVRSIQGEFWRGGAIAPDFKHQQVLSLFAESAVKYLGKRFH